MSDTQAVFAENTITDINKFKKGLNKIVKEEIEKIEKIKTQKSKPKRKANKNKYLKKNPLMSLKESLKKLPVNNNTTPATANIYKRQPASLVMNLDNNKNDPTININPEHSSFEILKLLKAGSVDIKDISRDDRINVIRHLRDEGNSIDTISGMLSIQRKIVDDDFNLINKIYKQEFSSKTVEELGGWIYSVTKTVVEKAIKAGKYSQVLKMMQTMIETLQSMGIVYKAPQKLNAISTIQSATSYESQRAFNQYQDAIHNDRDKVIDTMTKLLSAIRNNEI